MRMYNFVFISALIMGSLKLAPLSAQAVSGEELVTTTFRCISWGSPLGEPLYVKTGGSYQPLRIHHLKRSEELRYVGPNPIVFHTKKENPEGTVYVPTAAVQVDVGIRRPLFFFVPENEGFRIRQLEDSFEVFPTGSYRFHNFTDQKLLTKFGDEILTLDPKKTTVLQEPFDANTEYPILVVVREPDGLKPLYSNRWRHNENYRYMILVSASGSKDLGPIEFRILTDFPKPDL